MHWELHAGRKLLKHICRLDRDITITILMLARMVEWGWIEDKGDIWVVSQ